MRKRVTARDPFAQTQGGEHTMTRGQLDAARDEHPATNEERAARRTLPATIAVVDDLLDGTRRVTVGWSPRCHAFVLEVDELEVVLDGATASRLALAILRTLELDRVLIGHTEGTNGASGD